jgi:DNA repair protein RecN (Recombination protein N)
MTASRLSRLEIEDYALIARASLEFAAGFTVCSGETGSGKTMLLGALSFALGGRASADIVRAGATRARVTLEVEADAALREHLAAAGFDAEPDEPAILARDLLATGKSTARVNGRLATAAQIRAIGELLVEQTGQHEAQRLLASAYQLDVLDAFAGPAALARRVAVRHGHERVCALEAELASRTADAGRALAELEFARYAAREIELAAIEPGEDERLRERRDYLANVERISAALAGAHAALGEGDGAAVEALGVAATSLASVARYSADLGALAAAVAALQSDATDVAIAVGRALEATEFDASELEAATARLDVLEKLKKKYGGSLEAVLATRERFAGAIEREATRDEREATLRAELASARTARDAEAVALHALRVAAARELETRVAAELTSLAMPAARFVVELEALEVVGPSGSERASFALAANPGEPPRPLARAASGGELSRVLLALVTVLADRREPTALVFDEIDAGIGGATASAVGVRLGTLARATQVLCVTHLAQIASWADRHYVLRKRSTGTSTYIELVALEEPAAVRDEIARMLSGSASGVALEHAETLVRDARTAKGAGRRAARTAR